MTTSSLSIAAQQTNEQYNIEYNDQLQFLSLKASLLNLAPENLEALQNDVQQLVNRNPDFQDAQFYCLVFLAYALTGYRLKKLSRMRCHQQF